MTSSSLKKFIWNNAIVFILLNSSGALNYIFQIILGRTLTPDQYGSFNSLLAMSALITTPFTILHLVFSRFIARMTENKLQKIKTILTTSLKTIFIIVFGIVLISAKLPPSQRLMSLLLIPATIETKRCFDLTTPFNSRHTLEST